MPKYETLFNFDDMNVTHKKLVRDIIKRLEEKGVDKSIGEELHDFYELEDIPEFDLKNSLFQKVMSQGGVYCNMQGHVRGVDSNDKPMKYPVVTVCDDVRKLDKAISNIYDALSKQSKL